MKAFYFAKTERKLGYGDNRSIAVGKTHTVEGKPMLCLRGLHASVRLMDALNYAPGPILYLVELDGEMDVGDDKVAATSRKYLAEFDATEVLRKFARLQALINIEKIKPYCDENDYKIIVEWLETGNETLRAAAKWAAESARYAGEPAARAAARAAARYVGEPAARAAARAAARSAECAADAVFWAASAAGYAKLAAEYDAEYAAETAADKMLTDMIRDETGWNI